MSRDSNREHQTAAEALEFVQSSLFPTCSGALVAALVLLLTGFGGRNSSDLWSSCVALADYSK